MTTHMPKAFLYALAAGLFGLILSGWPAPSAIAASSNFDLSADAGIRYKAMRLESWAYLTAQKAPAETREPGTANPPDNTGRNARDRENKTLTPMDQSNDPHDLELTRQIRKALTDDDSLSTDAKNIKIITINGKVTLRGPVTSAKERSKIADIAKAIAGNPADNKLEVKSK